MYQVYSVSPHPKKLKKLSDIETNVYLQYELLWVDTLVFGGMQFISSYRSLLDSYEYIERLSLI
jgi:hypothetical protein